MCKHISFSLVENIVFCRPTPLQCTVYRQLLSSRLLRSCLYSSSSSSKGTSPHLVCIGTLKKLCNCPSLVYTSAVNSGRQVQMYMYIRTCIHVYQIINTCIPSSQGWASSVLYCLLHCC